MRVEERLVERRLTVVETGQPSDAFDTDESSSSAANPPLMEAMIENIPGVKVMAMHHDIGTRSGEEVLLFTLARPPDFRETKTK